MKETKNQVPKERIIFPIRWKKEDYAILPAQLGLDSLSIIALFSHKALSYVF
jgi:hypothetical protein